MSSIGTSSSWPVVPAQIETTCSSTGNGWYCGCLSSSTSRAPRSSWAREAASRSDANAANASRSRYCDRLRRRLPATDFIALMCALPPTRDRERATWLAGPLGPVVEAAQRVLALVHPVLRDGRTGVGRDVLVTRRVRGGGGDDRGVLERARLLQGPAHLRDRGALLADRDVDAAHLADRVAGLPVRPLVDDR